MHSMVGLCNDVVTLTITVVVVAYLSVLICHFWTPYFAAVHIQYDMMQLTVEDRWKIVFHMNEYGGDVNYTKDKVGCHARTVRRWWNRYRDTNSVDAAPGSGRPRMISKAAGKTTMDLLMHEDNNGSEHVARTLAAKGITSHVVHKTTVIRAAKRAAREKGKTLRAKKGPPAKGMKAATKAKRLVFASNNLNMDWGLVMFTDRKRFYLRYPGSKVKPARWVFEGEEESDDVFQPTNPQCVNVYAGISPYGMTAMHIVADTSKHKSIHKTKQDKPARNITRSEYIQVLKDTLLPEGTRLFKKGNIRQWYLQQDNDPTHAVAADVVQEWNQTHGAIVKLLPNWPPSSPDLNIIENVWSLVQQEVNRLGCQSFDEFQLAVEETFASVPQDIVANLYTSLEKRMELVVQKEGGYTKY